MILKADEIAALLATPAQTKSDRLVIRPEPPLDELRKSGAASIDLRLGTWFVTLQRRRMPSLDTEEKMSLVFSDAKHTRMNYVPFGSVYYLHPGCFVLAATLEWIRMPRNLSGYVIGRSSWGRRGLVIATAAGVHPGFTGCLTLELTNVGEIPLEVKPGLLICQLFIHTTTEKSDLVDRSKFIGFRRPTLGQIGRDRIAEALAKASLE